MYRLCVLQYCVCTLHTVLSRGFDDVWCRANASFTVVRSRNTHILHTVLRIFKYYLYAERRLHNKVLPIVFAYRNQIFFFSPLFLQLFFRPNITERNITKLTYFIITIMRPMYLLNRATIVSKNARGIRISELRVPTKYCTRIDCSIRIFFNT